MSAVGLLPMALEGFEIDNFFAGAAAMDKRTRAPERQQKAAMLLGLCGVRHGRQGAKDMVTPVQGPGWRCCQIPAATCHGIAGRKRISTAHCAQGMCLRQPKAQRPARYVNNCGMVF